MNFRLSSIASIVFVTIFAIGSLGAAEIFYRWQLSKGIAITPDLQYLVNPALDPEADSVWVFGLRVRGAL